LADLDTAVCWDLLTEAPQLDGFCKYWHNRASDVRYVDRMGRRHAEFLIKNGVALHCIARLGVIDAARQRQVHTLLNQSGVGLTVEVMPSWYF
jgi:hypothetical protein